MDTDSLLAVHARDPREPVQAAVEQVRTLCDVLAGTGDMPYEKSYKQTLLETARANAAKAGADDLRARLAEKAREDADAEDERAEDERVRLTGGHPVDPARFTHAQSPAEISALLSDALALDVETARRSWSFAAPVLKAMASKEARQYQLPHSSSAFSVWTIWSTRMARLLEQAPDRATMVDRSAREQRELKEKVLAVWRTVNLDQAVAAHLTAADVKARTPGTGKPAPGGLTFGKFFDMFPTRK